MASEMYVVQAGHFYELRQTRFRAGFLAGAPHPHDVCAVAPTVEGMHAMVDKYWPDADYSEVEASTCK
jgi:hypothetical protein